MKRKILVIVLVFLTNILWVNAIKLSNSFIKEHDLMIKINNNSSLSPNNNQIIEDLDVLLSKDLEFDGESAINIGKKIDKTLKSDLEGKGEFIAKYSIINEVDPYLIAAIILTDTNCEYECSTLVKQCNNVSKKMYNKDLHDTACFGGYYLKYISKDDSIKDFIKDVKNNFYINDLKTPNEIRIKYKKDVAWAFKVNRYIEILKNNSIDDI